MKLSLTRFGYGLTSTLGRLSMDGTPVAFTIEDERRKAKIRGETCIPVGTYAIKLRRDGGLHAKYSERFRGMHEGMLWLQDVPGFQWVYLHVGNKESETDGCPLIVSTPVITMAGEFEGQASVPAYTRLYPLIAKAVAGEGASIAITEREAA